MRAENDVWGVYRLAIAVVVMAALWGGVSGERCLAEETPPGEQQFAGFPAIGIHRPGERSAKVLTSDSVSGVVRPKWTRAMTDLGGWPAMYRFKGTIYLVFGHVDAHRGKQFEATGRLLCYASSDEGRTWGEQPSPPVDELPEYVVAGDTLYSYYFSKDKQTHVRTSSDGVTWSEPSDAYKPPFWLWGAMYDPGSEMFWAPPHAIPSVRAGKGRQVHLINSRNGLSWDYVSTVAPFENASESVVRFEEDRTAVVLIRRKYGATYNVAVAKPPYREWEITERPGIVEGEHFFEIGGQTFLASRAGAGVDPKMEDGPRIFEGRPSYAMIYKFTRDRRLVPWAVMDSMGDCSYPHLVETPTEILCAYYSQHEDKVCKVYLSAFDKREFLREKDEPAGGHGQR